MEKIVLLQQKKGEQMNYLLHQQKKIAAATKRFVDKIKHFVVVTK